METIAKYCKQDVEGWDKLPFEMFPFPAEDEPFFCSFLNKKEAIQIMCSMKGAWIHVSLAPVVSIKPGSVRSKIVKYIDASWQDIIKAFFGNLKFAKQPDHPQTPHVKHFVSLANLDLN